jgi:quercetin dioxygenase-like cupin family protein
MSNRIASSLAIALCAWMAPSSANPSAQGSTEVRVALVQPLPALDGAHLKATVVEVTYAPGDSSTPHRHPCPVIVYVISGALRAQVTGSAERVYRPGESFYESPAGAHLVSANASTTQPVRFLAYFTCDRETPLSIAVPERGR